MAKHKAYEHDKSYQLFMTNLHHDALALCKTTKGLNMRQAINSAIRAYLEPEITELLEHDGEGKYTDDLRQEFGYGSKGRG